MRALLLLATLAAVGTLAQTNQAATLNAQLAVFSRFLNNTRAAYTASVDAVTVNPNCALQQACPRDYAGYHVDFNTPNSAIDRVQIKVPGDGTQQPTAAQRQEGCEVMALGASWRPTKRRRPPGASSSSTTRV